jgi:tetratricopeptide (TPR) repeat protein
MRSYPRPKTFEEFEQVSLEYLRREWNRPSLVLYAKRGERQFGVDIVDMENVAECWAAQCKLHEEGKTLQAAEVRESVEKADGFPRTIRRYAVCTTGKKTRHAQDAVLELNSAREPVGKSSVQLIYWEDIELRLDSDDEFRERYGVASHSSVRTIVRSELRQEVAPGLASIQEQLDEMRADGYATNPLSTFDADLSRAKKLLDAHDFKGAEAFLRDLKETKYDRMSALQRFRCLTNLGVIEYHRGNDDEAGRLMLKATEEYPAHEKALTNRAHAHNLLGNHAEAWTAIRAARTASPADSHVAAAFVAYAPPDQELDALQTEVAATAADPKVLTAFASRCLEADDYERSLLFIARLKDVGHETPDSLFIEGRAIAGSYLPDDPRDAVEEPAARERIRAALSVLDRAARDAETGGDLRTALGARTTHSDIAGHLKDDDLLEQSLEESARLAAGFPRALAAVNAMRSQLALTRGRYARALDYAERALRTSDTLDAAMLHAVALLNRGEGADHENGRRELRRQLPRLEGPNLEQALNILVTDQLGQRRYDAAREAVQEVRSHGVDPACALAQEARIAGARGDQAQASRLLKEAAGALGASSTISTRRMIGAFLRQANELDAAVDVLEPLASRSSLTADTRNFLAIAMDAKRDDVFLEVCKDLWQRNALDSVAKWNYLCLLDKYDPEAALRLTDEAIAAGADASALSALKARRALVQRRLRRPVTNITLADIPQASAADSQHVGLFVEAMMCAGLHPEAVAFAYQSVLRFPDEASAHAALIRSFLFAPATARPLASDPTEVGVGCSVQIQEGDAEPTWHTVETSYAPGLADVIPASEPWVGRLLGRRVGDTATLAEGATGSRTVVVRAAQAASVFRFNDSMHTWQIRFPENPMLEESHLKTDPNTGELDLRPMLEFLQGQVENIKRIDAVYQGGAVPMSLMAEGAGRKLFQTMAHLAFDADLFINCIHGDEATLRKAVAALESASGVLLDGTAVWTLRELGLIDILARFPIPFGTMQETFDAIHGEPGDDLLGRDGGVLSVEGDKLALLEVPAEVRQNHHDSWQAVGAGLGKGKTYSSEALAALPTKRREEVLSFAGSWTAHAMAAAKQHGLLLWTDDRVVEFLAAEYFGVQRVWTQAVLFWLRDRGILDSTRTNRASAELQARRYTGTFTDPDVVVEAAKLAEWKPNSPMFQRNLKVIGDAATHPRACVFMATALIRACMINVRLAANQNAVISSVLERLKGRDRSLRLVRYVLSALPGSMQLNPLGAQEARRIIVAWLRGNHALLV